jgi:hypothetical protein
VAAAEILEQRSTAAMMQLLIWLVSFVDAEHIEQIFGSRCGPELSMQS